MCGIAGILGDCISPLKERIERMMKTFPYRGPDDSGYWADDRNFVGFGHRRLSILDTSSAGHQPMEDKENGLVLIHNGEIYNYLELRETLKSLGYFFRTRTDTEVILASYNEWGVDCIKHFNGMWAFAIWDKKLNQLFLSRDRMGIKPLYYCYEKGTLYFASELKAILAALPGTPPINPRLIDSYMSFGYIPGEDTFFQGIKRLLPGHFIKIFKERFVGKKYWDLNFSNAEEDPGLHYYVEKGRALFESALDLRLRSDVPLGVFLSGGLDSSAVVGSLAKKISGGIKTFTVAYDLGPKYNETDYARLISKKFNTDHYEYFITPSEFRDFIPEYIKFMDEPVTESAAISLYFISRLAKEHVTVILSGEGADEVFAGYDFYRYMLYIETIRKIFNTKTIEYLKRTGNRLFGNEGKAAKYLDLSTMPLDQRYKGISTYSETIKDGLYTNAFSTYLKQNASASVNRFQADLFKKTIGKDGLSRMLYFDIKTWLVDDLLIKADRMSMAASLELRVPFLDHRLVEFAASVPSKYKVSKGQGKYLLKKMMGDVLPKEILYRKKMGFPTPLKMMFEGELYGYARDLLLSSSSQLSTYFVRERIEKILQEHKSKKTDHHRLIWQLIVLDRWFSSNLSGHRLSR